MYLLPLLLLLLVDISTSLTCGADDVLCFKDPSDCTTDCDFILKYKAETTDTTMVEVSGKTSALGVSGNTQDIWVGFGRSTNARMSDPLKIYACYLGADGTSYTSNHLTSTGYGVSWSKNLGTVEGSLVDGKMTCTFTVPNSDIADEDLKMAYGMGTVSSGSLNKHSQTPRRSTQSFNIIQTSTEPEGIQCTAPTISGGTVNPTTKIDVGSSYTVTCDNGYVIEGSANIACSNQDGTGTLGDSPTCKQACVKPTVVHGTVTPDSASIVNGKSYTVTCDSNYEISGNSDVSCTNGALSTVPTCEVKCSRPEDPQDGTITPSDTTIGVGEQYTVSCEVGFSPSPSLLSCLQTGQLDNSNPSCLQDSKEEEKEEEEEEKEEEKEEEEEKGDPKCELSNKCHKYPAECSDSCDYNLTWKPSDDKSTVEVTVTGRPDKYSITDTDNIWIGYGFSSGGMSGAVIYLCKKLGAVYSVVKVEGFSWGVKDSVDITDSGVSGSFTDNVVSCTYKIKTSHFKTDLQKMIYGIGPVTASGDIQKHQKQPLATTVKFSFISDNTSSAVSSSFTMILMVLGTVLVLL